MNLLIDTHVFLWWILDDRRLSKKARTIMTRKENRIYLSTASAWEISIKSRIGKVELPGPIAEFLPEQIASNQLDVLAINLSHAMATASLPDHHRDPFDRMLVAQAISEKLPILTNDPLIGKYDVKVVW